MRKSIVIFGIIMAFILGSLVSAPSVAAPLGTPFLQEEIDAIEEIIEEMQDQLKNIRVAWVNVTHTPPGFAKDTFTGGIFQGNTSSIVEPCNAGDVVTWNGTHWVCADIGGVAPNIVVLHYEQTTPVTVPSTTGTPVLIEFAVWKIEKDDVNFAHDASRVLFDSSIYANIDGFVPIGWFKSKDRISWSGIDLITEITSTPVVLDEFHLQTSISSQINYIAFGTITFSSSGGVVKDFSGTITIHLPPGQSLNRIL